VLLHLLSAVILAQTQPLETHSVQVSVTDSKGAPVEGLAMNDVALLENGIVRDLVKVEPDKRPLAVLLLVDTSQSLASEYRTNIVDAVTSFVRSLPAGTHYSLWTTGDRPTKLVDFTDDPSEAGRALVRVAPQGGNTVLDALVEASQTLKQREGERTAVVAVTGMGIEFSNRDQHQVVDQAKKNASTFMAVEIDEGGVPFENRYKYEYVLSGLTKATGGLLEVPLSAMGVDAALQKVRAELLSQYRLTYETPSKVRDRKIEVRIALPGAKIRIGPVLSVN